MRMGSSFFRRNVLHPFDDISQHIPFVEQNQLTVCHIEAKGELLAQKIIFIGNHKSPHRAAAVRLRLAVMDILHGMHQYLPVKVRLLRLPELLQRHNRNAGVITLSSLSVGKSGQPCTKAVTYHRYSLFPSVLLLSDEDDFVVCLIFPDL